MRILFAGIVSELQKLFARRKYLLFLLFGLIICVLSVLANTAIVRSTYGSMADAAASVPQSMLYIASLMFVPAAIFIAASDMFSGEVYDYSIQVLLVRPISRMKIYLSKTIALFIMSAIFLAGMWVSAMLIELAMAYTVISALHALPSYAIDLIPLMTVALFAAFLNQFSGNAGFSIFLCAVLILGVYAIQIFVPDAEGFVFTKYLVWHNMWLGRISVFAAVQSCVVLMFYNVIFFVTGYLKFKTLEI